MGIANRYPKVPDLLFSKSQSCCTLYRILFCYIIVTYIAKTLFLESTRSFDIIEILLLSQSSVKDSNVLKWLLGTIFSHKVNSIICSCMLNMPEWKKKILTMRQLRQSRLAVCTY